MENQLKSIFSQFKIKANFNSYQELNSGHINDTFLITTDHKTQYVLQKINGSVFTKTKELIKNKVCVSNHLQNKFKNLPQAKIQQKVLCFVEAKDAAFYYKDVAGNYWNTSIFIKDSTTYLKAKNNLIAFEAGKVTGEFLELTSDLELSKITTILEDFHTVSVRYAQYKKALTLASKERINQSKKLISFIEAHLNEMLILETAIQQQKIPFRLTHNDTKISNILFSKQDKALCLIDTDTVMKGVLHFDYGDAIRTLCNTANEDETDVRKIEFNTDFFESYTKGFFEKCTSISTNERDLLPISIKILPFLMGLRFLTDFLNNDVYFKTKHKNHNLDRAINQFTFINKITQKFSRIETFIKTLK